MLVFGFDLGRIPTKRESEYVRVKTAGPFYFSKPKRTLSVSAQLMGKKKGAIQNVSTRHAGEKKSKRHPEPSEAR